LSGNHLFVANATTDTIGEYDATTGATINANFVTGLIDPQRLALSGNNLFVVNGLVTPVVGEYNATTGAAINANFITTVPVPTGIAVSGNTVYLVNSPGGSIPWRIRRHHGGRDQRQLHHGLPTPGTAGLALSGNNLFVANEGDRTVNAGNGTVGEYDATTGAVINANFITGLTDPVDLVAAPVPEPSTWSMITVGGVALLGMMLRKKRGIV
jgi:hypothetical protein